MGGVERWTQGHYTPQSDGPETLHPTVAVVGYLWMDRQRSAVKRAWPIHPPRPPTPITWPIFPHHYNLLMLRGGRDGAEWITVSRSSFVGPSLGCVWTQLRFGPCWWCRASCPRMSVDILGTTCDQCLSMVQCCFTSTETMRLIRTESPGCILLYILI